MPELTLPQAASGTVDLKGTKVVVYRNLIYNTFTVRTFSEDATTDVPELWLGDASFQVSLAGRLQALREGRKTIHAYIVGLWLPTPPPGPRCDLRVNYHPATETEFMTAEGEPVSAAPLVHLVDGKVFIPRQERWL